MPQDVSKPLSFPVYRRSHFRSQTYLTLVRIFSHLSATPDNDGGRMEQENPERGSELSELVGSAFVDPKNLVPEKIRQDGKQEDNNKVELMDYKVDGRLFDSTILSEKLEMQNKENNGELEEGEIPPNSLSTLIEKGDVEEGEIVGDFEMDGGCDSMLMLGNSKGDNHDHGNSSASKQKVDVINEEKRGPRFEERIASRKEKKRKNWAEKNKQLHVKRLKLHPAQKSKTIAYCHHYHVGRCHEGDKCKFSHDIVPLTKSTPCRHFARHSCMKGDDCPFDHELSKYPCDNFIAKGFCRRGYACLFSHQIPTTSSKVCRPELKSPLLTRKTNFRVPPNSRSSSIQQNHSLNSMGIRSHVSLPDKVIDTIKEQLSPAPKGISFINFAKSLLPNPSTSKQGMMITANEESVVQIGAYAKQNASGKNQTLVEIPKKLAIVAPKGANFLCFNKGSVCDSKSSITSLLSKEQCNKVSQFVNFGFPSHASSSLKKDDCGKEIDGTKQSVPKIDLMSKEISGKTNLQQKE